MPASRAATWVLSPSRDLLLFVATPVLIVPVALRARMAATYREAGREHRRASRLGDARADLRFALLLQPGDASVHFDLARVCRDLGDRVQALYHARRAAAQGAREALDLVRSLEARQESSGGAFPRATQKSLCAARVVVHHECSGQKRPQEP